MKTYLLQPCRSLHKQLRYQVSFGIPFNNPKTFKTFIFRVLFSKLKNYLNPFD